MKDLEELALTSSDITALLPKVIGKTIEGVARSKRYARQLLRLEDTLLKTKGRSIHLLKRGTVTASQVSEGSTPTVVEASYTSVEVIPQKYGLGLQITQEAIDGAEINIINDQLREVAEAMADKEDEVLFDAIADSTEATDTFSGDGTTTAFTLNHSPVWRVVSVTVGGSAKTLGTDYKVDYYDGVIHFVTAPPTGTDVVVTYRYSGLPLVFDAGTIGQLSANDILDARASIKANKYNPDVLVIPPNAEADLLKSTSPSFIDASVYGDREPMLNGEIGKFAGLKVLVSQNIPPDVAILIDTKNAGWFVPKREVEVKKWENPSTDSYEFYVYQEYAGIVTNDTAVALIVDIGNGSQSA